MPAQDPEDGPSTATCPRALTIPEVLKRVFEVMDNATGAAALRVSRHWFDVGLEARWYQLDSFLPLLEVIAPLVSFENDGEWHFTSSVGNADWTRFRQYANCVRVLKQRDSNPYKGESSSWISYETLAEVVFHHPFGPGLTPRLERLTWDNCRHEEPLHAIQFLSATLKDLKLCFTRARDADGDIIEDVLETQAILQTLRSIKQRAPNVQTFELDADLSPDILIPSLLDGVIDSRLLTSIRLPPFCQTSELAHALSAHPNLKNIEGSHEITQAEDERATQFVFVKDGFDDLENLCMESSFEKATDTFQSLHVPKRLEEVCLHHANYTTLEPLSDYFTALTQACSKLTSVGLCLYTNDWEAKIVGPLEFDMFRPLLDCHQLTSLMVEHNHAMLLQDSEVEEMGAAWKKLSILSLCFEPYWETVTDDPLAGNDFTIARHIAKALPLLDELGLYFNPCPIPNSMLEDSPEAQFKALKSLRVGMSSVPGNDPLAAGIFLESLCVGDPPSIEREDRHVSPERKAELRLWDQVVRTCQLVRKRVDNLRARTPRSSSTS